MDKVEIRPSTAGAVAEQPNSTAFPEAENQAKVHAGVSPRFAVQAEIKHTAIAIVYAAEINLGFVENRPFATRPHDLTDAVFLPNTDPAEVAATRESETRALAVLHLAGVHLHVDGANAVPELLRQGIVGALQIGCG